MNAQRKAPSFFDTRVRPLLVGLGVGLLVSFGLLVLAAAVVTAVDIPRSAVFPLAVAAVTAGAFVGGLITAALARRYGLLNGALCGLLLFLLIMLAGIARYAGVDGSRAAVKLAALVVAGSIGGVLGVNRRKK